MIMAKRCPDDKLEHTEEWFQLPESYLRICGFHTICYVKFKEANGPLAEHYHPGCMDITVMFGGSQSFVVEDQTYTLLPGHIFTVFPDEVHGSGREPQGLSEFIYLEINMRKKEGFGGLAAPFDAILYERLKNWKHRLVKLSMEDLSLIRQAFDSLARLEKNPEDMVSRMEGQAYFIAFLNKWMASAENAAEEKANLDQVLQYIEGRITEPLTVETVAEAMGISPKSLTRRFKNEIGMLPKEYINRKKVELARKKIEENEMSLTNIAMECGFSDSGYFSTVFKRFQGCTPSEYRKEIKRNQQ